MPKEVCLVTTFNRQELLYCCLRRLREADGCVPIHVFPDRGTNKDEKVRAICSRFDAKVMVFPDHPYYGNTANTMEAYRWAYNSGFDFAYLVEDDVMVNKDFFSWHRAQHEDWPDIFASMAWIFNRHAPIVDDLCFQPWIYSIGLCFSRDKLALIAEHATPKYYGDMPGYIERIFKHSILNDPFAISHWEQDGLLQRVLNEDKSQTVCPGIAKCKHVGLGGYNRGWSHYDSFFSESRGFTERVAKMEEFIEDPYWRLQYFDRAVVEREEGREIGKREFHYRINIGEWSSEFVSDLLLHQLPRKINSVPLDEEAKIERIECYPRALSQG